MSWAIPYRQRLPLGIAALGFAFLGLFLVYPLFQVFNASFLDSEGASFTFANYTKMLGRPFYRAAIANTLQIGVTATVITTLLAVPLPLHSPACRSRASRRSSPWRRCL